MTTLYLIRHGQKLPHAGDPGLTDLGKLQAKLTGEYLQQFPITDILSSPFKRAVETAVNIAEVLKLKVTLHQDLIERMNWDGSISQDDFLREWIKATNDRQYQPKYGESSWLTGARIDQLVKSIANVGAHTVLVTHGGAILDYLRNVFGDEKIAGLRNRYDAGEDYQMMNCAVNIVELTARPSLQALNYVGHLTELSE